MFKLFKLFVGLSTLNAIEGISLNRGKKDNVDPVKLNFPASTEIPKCPPTGIGCTLRTYWSEVSTQFCNQNIQPEAFEICNWIKTHCKTTEPPPPLPPVVPEPPTVDIVTPEPTSCAKHSGQDQTQKDACGAVDGCGCSKSDACFPITAFDGSDPGLGDGKCVKLPPPPPPCDRVSEHCVSLGRQTLKEHPCNRCGDCLDSINTVCPDKENIDNSLLMVIGGKMEPTDTKRCRCKCKDTITCDNEKHELSQLDCQCGCPDGIVKSESCQSNPLHRWDRDTCTCMCDTSDVDAVNQVQSPFPQCSISCNSKRIETCDPKLPTADCRDCNEKCEKAEECKLPKVINDQCECACVDAHTGRPMVETCEAKNAVLGEKTCSCECNPCENEKHVPDEKDCKVCACNLDAKNACTAEGVSNSRLDPDTCKWDCNDQACPGKQQNRPVINAGDGGDGGGEWTTVTTKKAQKDNNNPKLNRHGNVKGSFLETMEEGDNCQCSCQCSPEQLSQSCKEYQVLDNELCECIDKDCGANMIRINGVCECVESNELSCTEPAQMFIKNDANDACICGCDESLKKDLDETKFIFVEQTCSKQCTSSSSCSNAHEMERLINQDCVCTCSQDSKSSCATKGGKYDEKTCECVCNPAAVPFQLVAGTTPLDGCKQECVPQPKCKGTLDNKCICHCASTLIDQCKKDSKGPPSAPSCKTCGKCLDAPTCSARELFDEASCSCKCLSAQELTCPKGNTGVGEKTDDCPCLCAKPKDVFLQIVDPNTSCDPVCKTLDSCSDLDGSVLLPATIANKCECTCNQHSCENENGKTKSVWKNEKQKSQGCHCVCPKEKICGVGEIYNPSSCQCDCDPSSCTCGALKKDWENYCESVEMEYIVISPGLESSEAVCGCACSKLKQGICSKFGKDVGAVATRDTSTNHWSCPCECNSASTPCEGKQVRTNFEGFLPEAGDKSHLENFGKDLQVCSCACPKSTHSALLNERKTSASTWMDQRDTTCTKTHCSHTKTPLDPSHHIFNDDPRFCQTQCVTDTCADGKVRSAFPDCTCKCQPKYCSFKHELSENCNDCICKEEYQCQKGMIQNSDCSCSCPNLYCRSGSSVQHTSNGCECICDSSSKCDKFPNMELIPYNNADVNSCSCRCESKLPLIDGDFSLTQHRDGCYYSCDQRSSKALTCLAEEMFVPDKKTDTCSCQCDSNKKCPTSRFDKYSIVQLINRKRQNKCQCSCSLEDIESKSGNCGNKHWKVNRANCNCECPDLDALRSKCYAEGKQIDYHNCQCKCSECPGAMVLMDPNNCKSCRCPLSTLAKWQNFGIDLNPRLNANYYQVSNDARCDWDCSTERVEDCRRRNVGIHRFPNCGCEEIPPLPPTCSDRSTRGCQQKRVGQNPYPDCQCMKAPPSLRGERCEFYGVQSSFGSSNCNVASACTSGDCKTKSGQKCYWRNGKCGTRESRPDLNVDDGFTRVGNRNSPHTNRHGQPKQPSATQQYTMQPRKLPSHDTTCVKVTKSKCNSVTHYDLQDMDRNYKPPRSGAFKVACVFRNGGCQSKN